MRLRKYAMSRCEKEKGAWRACVRSNVSVSLPRHAHEVARKLLVASAHQPVCVFEHEHAAVAAVLLLRNVARREERPGRHV
jgi:hypothetical protein